MLVDFNNTIKERSRGNSDFQQALLTEAIELLLRNDVLIAKKILHRYIVEVIGINNLSSHHLSENDIARILNSDNQLVTNELLSLIKYLATRTALVLSNRDSLHCQY